MPMMRTDNEVKAFADGYKLCYQQFVDLLKSNCEVGQVLARMEIGLTTVNAAVEAIDANPQKYTTTDKDDTDPYKARSGAYIEDYRDQYL